MPSPRTKLNQYTGFCGFLGYVALQSQESLPRREGKNRQTMARHLGSSRGAEMLLSQVNGVADESKNCHLRQGTLLVDRVRHLNVEGGRLIKAAHRMIKQDVGVLEETRRSQASRAEYRPAALWSPRPAGEGAEELRGPPQLRRVRVARGDAGGSLAEYFHDS